MHETLLNFDELRYTWELDDRYVLFNSAKKNDEIANNYPNIKRIQISEKYSSDMVEKITPDELKTIIPKLGLLDIE